MNSTGLVGMALVALGLAGVFATGAATAAIPALFGLVFLVLALRGRNPAAAPSSDAAAAVVAALGLLAGGGNLLSRLAGGPFRVNAAIFANAAMALICLIFLAVWFYERWGVSRGGPAR